MKENRVYFNDEWNLMDYNEIKKSLYKEKPTARLIGKQHTDSEIFETILVYKTRLSDGKKVIFNIPEREAEGFEDKLDAQLLIRWLVKA